MFFQYFRSIRVLFAVYVGIIVLIVFLGFNIFQGDKQQELSENSKNLNSVARMKYNAITMWYSERYADAKYLFNSAPLKNSLKKYFSSAKREDSLEISHIVSSIYSNHDYSNLFIINRRSGVAVNLNPSGSSEYNSDSLMLSISRNKIGNSDIYVDKILGRPCLDIYAPVLLSENDTAVIVLKVDPEKLLFKIVSTWYVDNSSGECLIATSDGDSISYLSPLKFYPTAGRLLKKPASDLNLTSVMAVRGIKGIVQGKDYRGVDVLADVRRIENSPWYMVTKMDLAEVYEPVVTNTLYNTLILGLTVALGGILLLYYFTRSNYSNLKQISGTEKKFKSIFNNSTEAIMLLEGATIIDCNPSAEKLFGFPRKKIIGKTPGSFSPEYQPGNKLSNDLASYLIASTLAGKPQRFEWLHTNNQIGIVYTDISLSKMEIDNKQYVIAFLHDITERKLMNDALFESEQNYRAIFNSAPVGIYQTSTEGRFIEVNAALVRILGYDSAEDLKKVNIAEKIYCTTEERVGLIREYGASGIVTDHELQWRKKDGTIIWVQLNAFSVKDGKGNTRHYEGFVRDITSRKLAEEKLRDSETQYRNLVESINDIVFALNTEGIITFISSGVEKSTGYKPEELTGKFFAEYFHPDDRQTAISNFHNVSLLGAAQNEYRIITKSGKYHYFNASSTGIFNGSGFMGIRGVLTDINERKESEEKLKNQTHLLNETQHLAKLGSWERDYEKNQVFWSDEIYQILGVNREEVIRFKEEFNEFIHKDDLDAFLNACTKSMNPGVDGFEIEHRIIRKDNSRVRFVYQECKHFRNAEGEVIRTIGMLQDITERVITGKHIQTLTKAIEQSPVSVVITDLQGSIQYVNNKFTEVTGYSLSEVVNRNPRILKSGFQSVDFYNNLWSTILSGNTWSGELQNKKKNGELYWENAIISPIVDAEGKILNFVAVKEDITEKKKMLEDLITAKEKAEESNRLKSNFLANMSHELRTPMVGILGYADILISELSDMEHIELAKMILSSGGRLIETLNSILDLSSIEAKRHEIKLSLVDVYEVLNDTIKLFTPIASAKGLYLNSNMPGGRFNIYSDREMLAKIFNNLVNNAIKYTQTGHVSIEFSRTHNGDGKYIIIDIRDTGIGIPEEYHEIIFEPFRQVSEGYTRKFEGTGLGLSITSKLVHLLGGTITVKSNTGKGSVFTVKLPFIEADETHRHNNDISAISLSDFSLPRDFRLLIVEDDLSNAHLISAYLKPYCLVEHVINGESAINHCRAKKYDAILMDINLKGMNGIECLNQIRGINEHYEGIPVMAVTALAMAGDRERFLSLGFTGYLSKPFERTHLLGMLASVVKVTKT